ncbi:LptF/LptG family permease [Asticcacaulis solisilvae]|uniref:LptF/LptG family permease n=1 Tax=Asticcacaulis solisilvae TaxID=1217274 RepID=UPI003FD8388A
MNWQETLSYLNPWRKHRLETYILQSCVSMFGAALMVVAGLIFLVDYIGISKAVSARTDLSGVDIIGLILEKSPASILALLPFAFLFGSIFAFVSLNRRSELIAMRAAGVSAWRFITPAAVLAFAFGVLTITVLSPIASVLQDRYDAVANADGDTPVAQNTGFYMRQGDNQKQTVIRADKADANNARLKNATFWIYAIDPKGVPVFLSRVDAEDAVLRPGTWQLHNAWEANPGHPALYYDNLSISSTLDPQHAFRKYVSSQSVPFWQLPGLIHRNSIAGSATTSYRLKLHQLLSTPLMFAAMSMLGAVFSLRLMRLGGLTRLVVSGVSLGFVVFFVNQLFSSMGKADLIPVSLAGWSPPVLAILTAMTLLVYTEDG